MTPISFNTGAVKSSSIGLNMDIIIVSGVKDELSSLRHNVDSDIQARRNIRGRMNEARKAASILQKRFQKLHTFMDYSVESYSNAENSILKNVPCSKRDLLRDIIEYFKICIPGGGVNEPSFWDKLKVGVGAVVTGAKDAWASWKKKIEPGGEWYRAYQIIKTGAKLVLDIGVVVGAVLSIPASGGASTALAYTAIVYAVNDLVNTSIDMGSALAGRYDVMGKINVLKDGMEWLGENGAKAIGIDEKYGRYLGDATYYIGNIASIYYSLPQAVKKMDSISDLKKVVNMKNIKSTVTDLVRDVKGLANYDVVRLAKQVKSSLVTGKPILDMAKSFPAVNAAKEVYDSMKDIVNVEKDIIGDALAELN